VTDLALFPLSQYWWFYVAFTALVLVLLAVDLGVFHRRAHAVSVREAAGWSAMWVALALVFNYAMYHFMLRQLAGDTRLLAVAGFDPQKAAWRAALEFLAGYITEYSLSVDNIFVFVVILGYFQVPAKYQHRVLFFGILGALVFRGLFIALGALLLRFALMVALFGIVLIYTGGQMMFAPEKPPAPERNIVIRAFRRFVPVTTAIEDGSFVKRVAGRWHATPLLIALLSLELTDIVFAVDSVPAIFALTHEPLIVFTSNVFAILGLRSMYFMLAAAVDKFHMLKYGLGLVLIFVGLKMVWLNHDFRGHFPIEISLGIIIGVIGTSIALSLMFPKQSEES
jgi:tellurite resistance protein TerC